MGFRHIVRDAIIYFRDFYYRKIIRRPRIYLDRDYNLRSFEKMVEDKIVFPPLPKPYYGLKWGVGDVIRGLQILMGKIKS